LTTYKKQLESVKGETGIKLSSEGCWESLMGEKNTGERAVREKSEKTRERAVSVDFYDKQQSLRANFLNPDPPGALSGL